MKRQAVFFVFVVRLAFFLSITLLAFPAAMKSALSEEKPVSNLKFAKELARLFASPIEPTDVEIEAFVNEAAPLEYLPALYIRALRGIGDGRKEISLRSVEDFYRVSVKSSGRLILLGGAFSHYLPMSQEKQKELSLLVLSKLSYLQNEDVPRNWLSAEVKIKAQRALEKIGEIDAAKTDKLRKEILTDWLFSAMQGSPISAAKLLPRQGYSRTFRPRLCFVLNQVDLSNSDTNRICTDAPPPSPAERQSAFDQQINFMKDQKRALGSKYLSYKQAMCGPNTLSKSAELACSDALRMAIDVCQLSEVDTQINRMESIFVCDRISLSYIVELLNVIYETIFGIRFSQVVER